MISDDKTVYVLDPEEALPSHFKATASCLIFSGPPSDELISLKADVLYTKEFCSRELIVNELFRIFSIFEELDRKLNATMNHADTFFQICNLFLPFLHNPIALLTTSLHLLAYAEQDKDPQLRLYNPDDLDYVVTDSDVDDLTLHPEYEKSLSYRIPMIFPDDLTGYRYLYANIFINEKNWGRLLIAETDRPFRDSDFTLIEIASEFIKHSLTMPMTFSDLNNHGEFDKIIDALLQRKNIIDEAYDSILKRHSWDWQDSYNVYVFSLHQSFLKETPFSVLSRLENSIRYSIARQFGNNILFIVNLTKCGINRNDVNITLAHFVMDSIVKGSCSLAFKDLHDLADYYQQALFSLETGLKREPDKWFYHFEDYALLFAADAIRSQTNPYCYCSRGLLKLIQYDREKDQNYTNTLRMYLKCGMSIARTSKESHIHRQTLIYQLKRIKEITGISFSNYSSILYLSLSFLILDM